MTYTAPMPDRVTASPNLVTRRILTGRPAAIDSAEVVRHLVSQVTEFYNGVAAWNATQYNAACYTAWPGTEPVPVGFRDEQRKNYTPPEFIPPAGVLSMVPIPAGAAPAVGTDGHLGVVSGDTLTELWRARRDPAGAWSAVWGGRIDSLTTTTGQFPGYTGVSASGLMMPAHVVGITEARAKAITHAVGIGVTRVAAGPFSWPAVRTDGRSTMADALHMGRVFRLRPEVDLDAIRWAPWPGAAWRIHPLCRLVAEAAKVYGLVVVDTSGGVSMGVESGGPAKSLTGTDPWAALLAGWPPYRILGGFPWGELEAMPFDDGKPLPVPAGPAGAPR